MINTLKKLFEISKDIEAAEGKVDEEIKESGNDLEVQTVINSVSDFKKRRADDKREEDAAIKENKRPLQEKMFLVNEVIKKFKSLMRVNPRYEYYQIMTVYAMIMILDPESKFVISFSLNDPSLKKYTNVIDYLKNESVENLIYVLNNPLISSIFIESEKFWYSKIDRINIFRTVAILMWDPDQNEFILTYTHSNFLKQLANMNVPHQIRKPKK